MNKLTTKTKLKTVITIAILLVMIAYAVLVLAVMSADAAPSQDCMAGESWVRIYPGLDQITPQIYGWVYFLNKCGESYLIPIDPRVFVSKLSQTRCLEASCNHDPIVEPDGKKP